MSLANSSTPNYGERLAMAANSRQQAIKHLFKSEVFALTSLMGPMNDGPEWPSDASWLALNHDNCSTILSDGLSDPWVDRDRPDTGLGLEVFVSSPDIVLPESESMMALADTWLFPMTAEISHTLASYPRLCSKLLSGEPLSIRFNIEHIKDGRGLVGALLHSPEGMQAIETALGPIALVAATLLTIDELRWLTGKGLDGRLELLDRLQREGIGSKSLSQRNSVV